MNQQRTLTIVRDAPEDGGSETVSFLEWTGLDRKAAYVIGVDGGRRILRITLPTLGALRYAAGAVPESLPVAIRPTRLLPPPCRRSEAEAELLRKFRPSAKTMRVGTSRSVVADFIAAGLTVNPRSAMEEPELWELVYGECLAPETALRNTIAVYALRPCSLA